MLQIRFVMLKEFFDSKPAEWYFNQIRMLADRWQKIVDNDDNMSFLNKISDSELSPCTPSTSCSSSSYLTNEESIIMTKKSLCPICNDISLNKHFGVDSCNACAAFFRRSVSFQRRYTCLRGNQCHISFGNPSRKMCRFCRFQRCILAGMDIGAIFVASNDEFRNFAFNSPLRRILLAQRATFVNRYASQLKAYGGNHALVCLGLGVANPTFTQTSIAIAGEFPVLIEYLLGAGFSTESGLSLIEIQQLAKSLFYVWICLQSILNTLRNSGHKRRIGFFVDESHLALDDETQIENYVKTMNGLLDFESAAKATKRFFSTALHTANQIHSVRMSEPEHAVMFQVLALRMAAKLFPEKKTQFNEAINDLFDHLKRHYEKNFDDVALRLGNLILMLALIEKCARVFNECGNIFYLNGYNKFLNFDE